MKGNFTGSEVEVGGVFFLKFVWICQTWFTHHYFVRVARHAILKNLLLLKCPHGFAVKRFAAFFAEKV